MIHNYLSRHQWLTFTLSILGIAILFGLVYYLAGFIPENIRIVQLYNSFIVGLAKFMKQVASVASIYTVIGHLLNGVNVFVNYLVVIGAIIGLFLVNYLISRPLFFFLTSRTSENTLTRKHHAKTSVSKGLFWTFLRKEITIAKRSPNELFSNYAVMFFMPIIMYVLNSIYMGMDRSSLGNQFVLIFNVMITLIIIAASNTASAVAITTE
ncbi:MAG TPA: hypothetical protein PKU69_05510, partial [Bacillota bacterium]|nr:hypothetical protein [Bacillota bacterium]